MKFTTVIALLAPAVLAAAEEGWIELIKEQCPDMPENCVDAAKSVHQPNRDFAQIMQVMPTVQGCTTAYGGCIQNLGYDVPTFGPQERLFTCLQQIAPDHFKYFLDNDSAESPIATSQNCPLRELHRVVHVELGPRA